MTVWLHRALIVGLIAFPSLLQAAEPPYEQTIRPLLSKYCFDCHFDGDDPEGGVNLEQFRTTDDVLRRRSDWKAVFDKVESHQMPPPKEAAQPSDDERKQILAWITQVAAQDDPHLAARDPGQPVLRRLTRLEYNNTVRDLLRLDTDVFMFPERLPLADKRYFQPATGKLEGPLTVKLREYGAKHPVLLPSSGLAGDSRADHGYRNRGDAMNLSPLMLEKYVALAGEITHHPDLPRRSPVFAELLGIDPQTLPTKTKDVGPGAAGVGTFAPDANRMIAAEGNPIGLDSFRGQIAAASKEGRGGVVDIAEDLGNTTLAGKGGLLKTTFGGDKQLTINPNADLWLVRFATASPASQPLLIANKEKGEKQYELTFAIRDGDEDEGVRTLGLCVLARKGQSGKVLLVATFSDGTTETRAATFAPTAKENAFAAFEAHPGESIRKLAIDGRDFTGDYVLIDDLGFITDGQPRLKPPVVAKRSTSNANNTTQSWQDPPRERLARFLERAFRRTTAAEEVDRYFAIYQAAREQNASEADAMRAAAHAVLSSPSFLYLTETTVSPGTAKVRQLNDFELATRLSYFLWASMPDDELFALAKASKLQDETAIRRQAERMVRDPKARELSESFSVQWLRLDQLYTSKPDRQLFPQFYAGPQGKATLHGSQLVEALLLFETVLIEDRSILDFVAADYTWLNPAMAKLYGIDRSTSEPEEGPAAGGVTNRELKTNDKDANHQWQRVRLPDATRGGYLTMSAPLTVTSLPFRTSPVKRGAWLLETVFHRPPTEPKVAFTIENDTKEAAAAQSVRAKFEAHRNQAACYSCHIRLDPPGFALERFNAVGAWRDKDGGAPVDARGEWNSIQFDGPAEFKALLRDDPHEFTRGFIEHLLSYALARPLDLHDLPTVAAIEEAASQNNYRFQQLVSEIVASYPFRHTRTESEGAEPEQRSSSAAAEVIRGGS